MKLLITGASGYIGSKVINYLKDKADHLGVTYRSEHSKNLLSEILPNSSKMFKVDLTNELDLELNYQYDCFVHLAAANDVDSRNSKNALLNTTLSTKNCLDFCAKNGIKKFIYFSTFQVIGHVVGALDENKILPLNDYALTHRFSEEYVEMYHRTKGLDFLNLRLTNIYGAPLNSTIERWTLVPNCFCLEAFKSKTITLRSSGNQVRDFINLNDIGPLLFSSLKHFDKIQNQTINISSGNKFSILEIAQTVKRTFQNRYNEPCELVIESDHPIAQNQFEISKEKLNFIPFSFSEKKSLVDEINKIFNLLEYSN